MFVPALRGHETRNGDKTQHSDKHGGHQVLALGEPLDPVGDGQYAKANPDGEGVERSGIGIVAFTRLVRSLVQIYNDGDASQDKQKEDDPARLQVLAQQPEQATKSQDEGQEIICRASWVLQSIRDILLVAETGAVDEVDAADPVAVLQLALALNVVLTAYKVPHEIAPVHPVALIADKELEVLPEGGFVDHLHGAVDGTCRDFVSGNHATAVLAVGLIH